MEISRRCLIGALELIAQDLRDDKTMRQAPVTHEEVNEITRELLENCCLTPEHVKPQLKLLQGGKKPFELPPIPTGDDAA